MEDHDYGDVSYLAHLRAANPLCLCKIDLLFSKVHWSMAKIKVLYFWSATNHTRSTRAQTTDRRSEICKRGDDDGQNPIVASYFRIATPSGCSLMGSISGLDESTAIAEQAPKSALRETRGVAAKTPIFERNVGRRRRSTLR